MTKDKLNAVKYPESIVPYEKNAKEHTDEQLELIARSISRFGWQQPIKVGKDNVILVGHGRFMAYNKYKDVYPMAELWVINEFGETISGEPNKLRLTPQEEIAYRLADNQINALTQVNNDLVLPELKALPDDLKALTGFSDDLLLADQFNFKTKEVNFLASEEETNKKCPNCGYAI